MAKIYYFKGRVNKMAETNIFEVAKAFLSIEPMTHKKLQKLCYYAYAWYLTLYKKKLFDNKFEAWIHGPVNPELYHRYKEYGWDLIPKVEEPLNLNSKIIEFVHEVFDSYGHLDGDQLEYLTHTEQPWQSARHGLESWEPSRNVLDDKIIMEYYRKVFENGQND